MLSMWNNPIGETKMSVAKQLCRQRTPILVKFGRVAMLNFFDFLSLIIQFILQLQKMSGNKNVFLVLFILCSFYFHNNKHIDVSSQYITMVQNSRGQEQILCYFLNFNFHHHVNKLVEEMTYQIYFQAYF